MRRNIALVISYDGTDFAGWQVQNEQRSVQGTIEDALRDLHGEAVSLTGAGRTDSGVHAIGQVGHFYTGMDSVPGRKFRDALNARLPRDIRILSSVEVPEGFHSRHHAVARRYEYRLIQGPVGPAHLSRFSWLLRRMPPIRVLNDMAGVICGMHDFTTFTAAGDTGPHRVRTIHYARFLNDGPTTLFRIKGNRFLWRMVRSLLGTMVDLGTRGGDVRAMRGILESRDRDAAGPTAPPRGLFLTKVEYEPNPGLR